MLHLSSAEALLAFLIPKFKVYYSGRCFTDAGNTGSLELELPRLQSSTAGEEEKVESPVNPMWILGLWQEQSSDMEQAKAKLPAQPGSTKGRGNSSLASRASPCTNPQHLLPGELSKAPVG